MATLESIQKSIVLLMANSAINDKEKIKLLIQDIKQVIFDYLDNTSDDEEIVRCGKFLKILEDLDC